MLAWSAIAAWECVSFGQVFAIWAQVAAHWTNQITKLRGDVGQCGAYIASRRIGVGAYRDGGCEAARVIGLTNN